MVSIDKAQFKIKESEREMSLGVSISGPPVSAWTGEIIMEILPKLKDYIDNNRSVYNGSLPPITDLDEQLEIDSLGLIRLIAFLENEFGYRIEDDEITADNFATLRKLGDLLTTKTPVGPTAEAKLPSS